MKQIITKHTIDFNEIRRLALICHGLGYSTSSFSRKNSNITLNENLSFILKNLLSSNLLNLAIAVRVNIYQLNIKKPDFKMKNSAWFYLDDAIPLKEQPITLKDLCDKIIHADTVEKLIYREGLISDDCHIALQLRGKQFKKKWTVNVVLEKFAEELLNILDELDN